MDLVQEEGLVLLSEEISWLKWVDAKFAWDQKPFFSHLPPLPHPQPRSPVLLPLEILSTSAQLGFRGTVLPRK